MESKIKYIYKEKNLKKKKKKYIYIYIYIYIYVATEFHHVTLYFMLPLVQPPYLPVDHFYHFTILLSESTESEVKSTGILLNFLFIKWSLFTVGII